MNHRFNTWLAWSLVALAAGCDLGGGGLLSLTPAELRAGPLLWPEVLTGLSLLVYALVGALVATRQPRNPIGWILCTMGLATEMRALALAYVRYALLVAPGGLPAVELVAELSNLWLVTYGLVPLLVLLFPDGQPLSRRWGPIVWLSALFTPLTLLLALFRPGPFLTDLPQLRNPLGIEAAAGLMDVIMLGVAPLTWLGLIVCAGASLVLRFRRAGGTTRAQLKWLAFAGVSYALLSAVLLFIQFTPQLNPDGLYAAALYQGIPNAVGLAAIPVAAGIAILRHHLYDIDLLISRSLLYGALTACIVAIYALVVGVFSTVAHAGGSPLVSLVATGIAAVLFQPLRERLQRGVNRLLYGERDDPYAVLTRLGQRLEQTLTHEAVLPTIVQTIRQALKLPYAAILVRSPAEPFVALDAATDTPDRRLAAASGTASADVVCLPVTHRGEIIGELLVGRRAAGEAFDPAERRLLDELARQAGVAVYAARLTEDLRRSREQLVSAREEERRRLRRDLHDGLGPRLASLTLRLETARDRLAGDAEAERLLADLAERTRQAVGDIRRLVYALRPPALDDLGLVSALREGAAQYGTTAGSTLQITVEAPDPLPPLPAAVEVATYRIVQEALTNVVRHAQARHCRIGLTLDASAWLSLEIRDDGRGVAPGAHAGVGLTSMRERAEELGGTWRIERLPDGGTCVRARLPCRRPGLAGSEHRKGVGTHEASA